MKPFFGLSPGRTSFKAQAPVIKLSLKVITIGKKIT